MSLLYWISPSTLELINFVWKIKVLIKRKKKKERIEAPRRTACQLRARGCSPGHYSMLLFYLGYISYLEVNRDFSTFVEPDSIYSYTIGTPGGFRMSWRKSPVIYIWLQNYNWNRKMNPIIASIVFQGRIAVNTRRSSSMMIKKKK